MRILVVEDNPKMLEALRRGLSEMGHAVDTALTGFDGEHLAAIEPYDLVVLDVMLPDRDGKDVARALRRRKITTPILMLSALSATEDKVAGLDSGADDYLAKPFEFEELGARVRALLRRGDATEAARLEVLDVEMDLRTRNVTRAGKSIVLTPKEYALLELFLRNPGRVLERVVIGEKVWDMNFVPESNVIDVYVSQLRRKLDIDGAQPIIETVVGVGYRFAGSG
jgi:DNA-binding response OmpR family regulator